MIMKASALLLFILSLALGSVPAAFSEIRGWHEENERFQQVNLHGMVPGSG